MTSVFNKVRLLVGLLLLLISVDSMAVEVSDEQVIASHTRSDMIITPRSDQLDDLSAQDIDRLFDSLSDSQSLRDFFNTPQGSSREPASRNFNRAAKTRFLRATLIRVEPRSLNNPFNVENPINNAFVNGQVLQQAADQLNNNVGVAPPVANIPPAIVPPVGNVPPADPVAAPPAVAPPVIFDGQFITINQLGAGGGLGFELVGTQLQQVPGFTAGADIVFERNINNITGFVNGVGLLPAGGSSIFFSQVFNLSTIFNAVNSSQAVSSIDGSVFVLGPPASFAYRSNNQNFTITARAALRVFTAADGSIIQPVLPARATTLHVQVQSGDINGVIPPLNCPAVSVPVLASRNSQALIQFDFATSTCTYNPASINDADIRFFQPFRTQTRNVACGQMTIIVPTNSLIDGTTGNRTVNVGTTHTITLTDIFVNTGLQGGSGRSVEINFTVRDNLLDCINASDGINAAETGAIIINSVQEL